MKLKTPLPYQKERTAVARFTLATTESFRLKNGESQTNTEWHAIIVWRGVANFAESGYVDNAS